ncbi:MAG: hypothetical protein D4R97_08175 [Bacteroidetes bacterium]|nr:MAG: hypothetical protein D4R97_08175 [Bacteroidota bacterium]
MGLGFSHWPLGFGYLVLGIRIGHSIFTIHSYSCIPAFLHSEFPHSFNFQPLPSHNESPSH